MLPKGRCILAAVLTCATVSYSKQLRYDRYLTCPGQRLTHATGLPQGYSEATYSTSLALCSAYMGAPQNAGCFCTSPGDRVYCNEGMADPTLYHAPLDWHPTNIAFYCMYIACHCRTEQETTSTHDSVPSAPAVPAATSTVRNPYYRHFSGPNPFRDAAERARNREFDPLRDTAGGGAVGSAQCGLGCSSDEECQSCTTDKTAAAADQYKCRAAAQSKFNPTVGGATFISMCLRTIASGGQDSKEYVGKRDEELPCPCNSTYISHGCCSAKDGLVWEPAEFYLGGLDKDLSIE